MKNIQVGDRLINPRFDWGDYKVMEVFSNGFIAHDGKYYTFQEAKDWKIVEKEEEEPKEHTIFPDDLVAPLTNIRRMKIDGTEYTIDYILDALKAYEE